MKKRLGILIAVLALSACDRTPLNVGAVREAGPSDPSPSAPVATATDTQTATQPTATDTSSATGTATDTQTATTPITVTTTATATATETVTATSASSGTFKILSVEITSVDAFGNNAPDVRSFGVQFTGWAMDVDLQIYIKGCVSDCDLHHSYIAHSPAALYISPGDWAAGGALRPNSTYQWMIKANEDLSVEPGMGGTDQKTGEFTTGSYDPGTVAIEFTTALHGYGFTDAIPGQKDSIMGTVFVLNTTPHTIGLDGLALLFKGWTPAVQSTPFIEGSIGDYLTNCRFVGWPDIQNKGEPFIPAATTVAPVKEIIRSQSGWMKDVRCDLTDAQPSRTTKVAFEVTDQGNQISGLGKVVLGQVNGDPPLRYIMMVGKKDLGAADPLPIFLLQAADSPPSRIITANTADNTVSRHRIFGANESVTVQALPAFVLGNDAAWGGNAVVDIVSLRLFDQAMSLFCSGALDSYGKLYCRNDAGLFTVDGEAVITTKANIDQVYSPEKKMAVSGDVILAGILTEAQAPAADRLFKAVGNKSGRSYYLIVDDPFNGSSTLGITGNVMTIRKTQPTVATVPLSENEKKIRNSTTYGFRQTVHRFSITAANNADVSLKRISVDSAITKTGAAFYELHVDGRAFYADVSNGVKGIVFNMTDEFVVSAGTTKTFEVSADLYSASQASAIVTKLPGDDSYSQNFLWSDNSADKHSLTSSDWWNGYLVNGLPTVEQTLLWQ